MNTPQSDSPAETKDRERLIIKINLSRNRKKKASPTKTPIPVADWLKILSLLLQKDLTKEYEAFQKQKEESKERLRQKYQDYQSKKKEGKIKMISFEDLPMPVKKQQQQSRVPKQKPEEAPKAMGMTRQKHAVPMKKRGEKIKNFLKKRTVHRSYRSSSTYLY